MTDTHNDRHHWTPELPFRIHPAQQRVQDSMGAQERVAEMITNFSGSMPFLYIHAAVFAAWCATGLFGSDPFPFNFLTMSVSLEAIFLATFVMISQNRQAKIAAAKAAHDYHLTQQLLEENTVLTREIHKLVGGVVPS